MSIRLTVISEIESIATQQNKKLPTLNDDLVLMNTGLDSLCFAILVARLEDRLGIDPFATADDLDFPVTLGEFVRIYEHAVH